MVIRRVNIDYLKALPVKINNSGDHSAGQIGFKIHEFRSAVRVNKYCYSRGPVRAGGPRALTPPVLRPNLTLRKLREVSFL